MQSWIQFRISRPTAGSGAIKTGRVPMRRDGVETQSGLRGKHCQRSKSALTIKTRKSRYTCDTFAIPNL